ncbi:MAG: Peptidyl-tRNA hydrolase protein 2, mitochondrial [Marteilia pararefringens]
MKNKMMLIVRNDLKMGKGKIATQCSHATLKCYQKSVKQCPELVADWEMFGQAKIVAKCDSLEKLKEIEQRAKKAGLVTGLITDAGRTQVEPNTVTVLGIGPAPVDCFQGVTSDLLLL